MCGSKVGGYECMVGCLWCSNVAEGDCIVLQKMCTMSCWQEIWHGVFGVGCVGNNANGRGCVCLVYVFGG